MDKIAFTEKRVAELAPPAAGRLEVADAKCPGLVLRVTSNGSRTYSLFKRVNGRLVRLTLGTVPAMTVDAARKTVHAHLADMVKGIDPAAVKRAVRAECKLADLWTCYLDLHAKPRKKTWQDDQRMYEKYMVTLHGKRLSAINQDVVVKWHGQLAKDHGPIQANRCKALLATMYAKGSKAVGFTGVNPCIGVKNFAEASRERFLLPAEMQTFFAALATEEPYWQAFFLLCLFTGSRRGNIASMEWRELDLQNAVWYIPATKTKNKKPTTIALCAPAFAILQTRYDQRNGSPYVFPAFKGDGHLIDPRKSWDRILTAAKIENLHMHDLRRTQGSWQAAMGISLAIIGKSLGHADLKSTQIYSRLQMDPVKDAVSRASVAMMQAGKIEVGGDGISAAGNGSTATREQAGATQALITSDAQKG